MKPPVWLFYGMRNLFGKKAKGKNRMLIPVISIALSLIPVIVILQVASGMIEGITRRYLEFDTGHLRLSLSDEREINLATESLASLQERSQVDAVYLERQGGGLLYNNKNRFFVNLRAVPSDLYRRDAGFRHYVAMLKGDFDLSEKNSIVIGKALAEEYGISVGEMIQIFTHQIAPGKDRSRFIARANRFKVTGIYSIGYQELDKATLFISFEDGKRVLAPSNSYTFLKIKVHDPFKDIEEQAITLDKNLPPQLFFSRLKSWMEINSNYYSAFQTTKVLLLFIMILIVLVAAFNVSSSMIMVVLDRVQEIGILKSIGMSPGAVTLAFIWGGFLTGLASTIAGLSLGLLIAVNINQVFELIGDAITLLAQFAHQITVPFGGSGEVEQVKILNPEYYLEVIPIRIDLVEVLIVGLFAVLLSVIFSFFPARMAGKIRPLEVIRKH